MTPVKFSVPVQLYVYGAFVPETTAVQLICSPVSAEVEEGEQVTCVGVGSHPPPPVIVVEHVADLIEAPDVTVTVAVLTPVALYVFSRGLSVPVKLSVPVHS